MEGGEKEGANQLPCFLRCLILRLSTGVPSKAMINVVVANKLIHMVSTEKQGMGMSTDVGQVIQVLSVPKLREE